MRPTAQVETSDEDEFGSVLAGTLASELATRGFDVASVERQRHPGWERRPSVFRKDPKHLDLAKANGATSVLFVRMDLWRGAEGRFTISADATLRSIEGELLAWAYHPQTDGIRYLAPGGWPHQLARAVVAEELAYYLLARLRVFQDAVPAMPHLDGFPPHMEGWRRFPAECPGWVPAGIDCETRFSPQGDQALRFSSRGSVIGFYVQPVGECCYWLLDPDCDGRDVLKTKGDRAFPKSLCSP